MNLQVRGCGRGRVYLGQDSDKWRAGAKTAINLRAP
jgi:hypothetical protein